MIKPGTISTDPPDIRLPLHALELRYVETPQSLRAGEAAAVVVEMTADGATASQLPELQLPAIAGAQVFPDPPQVDETFERGRLRTKVTRRFSLLPAQAGLLQVRGPRQGWWDVAANTARTASLPDLRLEVAAGVATPGTAIVSPSGAVAAARDNAVAAPLRFGGVWPWLALAFALLWLGTLAWALRLRARSATVGTREANATDAAAEATARPSPRELQRMLQTGDLGEVEQALLALATPSAADLDALARRLDDEEQRRAVTSLQQARWAGGDAAQARAALVAAFAQGPRWRVDAPSMDAVGQLLPPLYPERRQR